MSKVDILPSFSAETFISKYWQKKPVVLKSFIPNFEDPLTAEELAGLACEEFSESRLITESDADHWELKHGPFLESDFTSLPDKNWTLLVQAVDQFVDGVADLKNHFDFIPSWRIDDVMISFAAENGGVGPHFDHYDVFLLQGSGKRRWRISELCGSDELVRSDTELSILKDFSAVDDLLLSAGDVLYIPPRIGHWGTAETEGLCYSIGFRAPSHAEMLEGFSDFLSAGLESETRYQDNTSIPFSKGAEIDPSQLDEAYSELQKVFADRSKFDAWFGCLVSQAKYPELVFEPDSVYDKIKLQGLCDTGQYLYRNSCSRFAFRRLQNSSELAIFVDGNMAILSIDCLPQILMLCEQPVLTNSDIKAMMQDQSMVDLLCQLLNQGSLQTDESE